MNSQQRVKLLAFHQSKLGFVSMCVCVYVCSDIWWSFNNLLSYICWSSGAPILYIMCNSTSENIAEVALYFIFLF